MAFERCGELGGKSPPPRQAAGTLAAIWDTASSEYKKKCMTKEELLDKIKEAKNRTDKPYLTLNGFASYLDISKSSLQRLIERFYDKWSEVCIDAGVKSGPNDGIQLKPNFGIPKEKCIEEIKRVAELIGKPNISKVEFRKHSEIHPETIKIKFGSWENAMHQADLNVGKSFRKTITEIEIANDFLHVFTQLRKIPTISQMTRRGKFSRTTYFDKYKSYSKYKAIVVKNILEFELCQDNELICILENEAKKTQTNKLNPKIRPHYEGQTLGFRSFAYVPTYEQEVVGLFSIIAQEIGFEIITIREEFPDCKARRKVSIQRNRYKDCLIEFELNASDYKKHKHPVSGCDLIVCWENDWAESTLEIIELKEVIKKLEGWK